jgi:hypothetical protein
MAAEHKDESHDGLPSMLTTLGRIGSLVGAIVANRTAHLFEINRGEVRRAAAVLALALAAALFAVAAAGFAAVAVLVALGEEHRAAGATLIAGCFALLSGIAILLARGRSSPPPP